MSPASGARFVADQLLRRGVQIWRRHSSARVEHSRPAKTCLELSISVRRVDLPLGRGWLAARSVGGDDVRGEFGGDVGELVENAYVAVFGHDL
jgi:hypothetical protein